MQDGITQKKYQNKLKFLPQLELISLSNVLFVFTVCLNYETPDDCLGEGKKPSI
jgi:hypothetical protein